MIHFQVRKKKIDKKIDNFQSKLSTRENAVHSSLKNILVNNHFFILEWGQCHCQEKFHEEHNDTYCKILRNFLLNEVALKSHS